MNDIEANYPQALTMARPLHPSPYHPVLIGLAVVSSLLFGCTTVPMQPAELSKDAANDGSQSTVSIDAERLQQAVIDDDLATVRRLLDRGISPDIKDSRGAAPLYAAAAYGRIKIAQLLISRGANLNVTLPSGATLLHGASQNGQTDMVAFLLSSGLDPNRVREDGWSALHRAAEQGFFQMAQDLLRHGAHVDSLTRDGATPLYFASQNGHTRIAKLLMDEGANVNAAVDNGATPLHAAAARNHSEIVKLLVLHGAKVDARQKDGFTPALLAVQTNNGEIVRLLLDNGADVQATDPDGRGLLHMAARVGNSEIAALLLQRGARVDSISSNLGTPLDIAAAYGSNDLLNLLLSYGANPTIQVFPIGTAPDIAAMTNHRASADLLNYASGIKPRDALVFLPDKSESRYLNTRFSGLSYHERDNRILTDLSLIVAPTPELEDQMYLVAKLRGTDGQILGQLENAATGGHPAKELTFSFEGIKAVKCGLYRAEVEIYRDSTKDKLVGLHQQGIISTVDTTKLGNVGDIVTSGLMGTCPQEP